MTVRVLVVEDNRALAENVQELFEESGAEVTICANAIATERYLLHSSFDLAIVDVRLPEGVSGLELVPLLREASPNGEVILVTGNATLGSAIEAVRHGVFAYLQKPFKPVDLLALGERALAQVALRDERAALAVELTRSEALHRAVVDTVDSLIVGLDPELHIRIWSRGAAESTGWSAEAALGRNVFDILHDGSTVESFERALSAAIAGSRSEAEVEIETARGERRVIRWIVMPLHPEGTAQPMILAVGSDATEKLELEARAADAEALAAMGRLTAGLAHEVRNPLNAAKLQLAMIARAARKGAAEDVASRVAIVNSELDRLSRLLDEFLGLARPRHLAMCALDLRTVIEEVIALQAPVAQAAGITLEAAVGDIPRVHGDESKLKQALLNLTVNSIEAIADAGGKIVVAAEKRGELVEVRVEDTGPGLPQPAGRLLQPFVTTKGAGTGLGLTIVNRVVELHGGKMEIGPREGGGTVVRIGLRPAE